MTLNHYTELTENNRCFRRGETGHGAFVMGIGFLDTIRGELGLNQAGEQAAAAEQAEQAEREQDAGLTTEINLSRTMVPLADTIRSLVRVLARHPHGFRGDGTRDENGKLRKGFKPFTPEEDEAGQKWADGPKQGKEWATTGKLSTDCWKGGE